MARRSQRPALRPRVINDQQLAGYLGRSISWLTAHRIDLERRLGFPPRLPEINGNDLEAVDRWLDQLPQPRAAVDPEIERLWAKISANVR